MATKLPKIPFKAGDDFYLKLTVKNKTSAEAIAAAIEVVEAQALYDEENGKDNPDETLLATLLAALDDAKAAYENAIKVDIRDWTILSSMKWLGKPIADFTVTIEDAPDGVFTLEHPYTETQLWKNRLYDIDVQFVIDGKRTSSRNFQLDVGKDVTIEEVGP